MTENRAESLRVRRGGWLARTAKGQGSFGVGNGTVLYPDGYVTYMNLYMH